MRISRTPSPFLAWSAMLTVACCGIGAVTDVHTTESV